MSDLDYEQREMAPPARPAGPSPMYEELGPDQLRPARRRGLGPRSLTARLVFGVVSLVVVLVLVIGAATYLSLRSFLYDRLDQQLQSTVSGNKLTALFFGPSPGTTPGVHAPVDVWAVALDPNGNVLTGPNSSDVKTMILSASDRTELASRQTSRPETIETSDGLELRVTVLRVAVHSFTTGVTQTAVAVVGLSTSEADRTLHRLVLLELLIGAGAVVVAVIATAAGVRFSLRRLYRVTATAQEVAAELSPEGRGLERRVPVTDDGSEVGQLADSMNTLLAAIETQFAARLESEQRMRQFLADASHELRTPLTSIRGYAELARMRSTGDRSDDRNDDLARIESEGTRMSRLVDDLLVLARTDQADTPPARHLIDIAELLDDVVTSTRAAFPQRQIDLHTTPGLAVVGDPDQLLRVVRNLCTNAAVHTDPHGPIRVTSSPDGVNVVIQVIDSGPGLPPEEAAHVFERFWRADKARTRARGGSGLGLAIVASLVRANGGTVRFDSSVAQGSTVTVRLPAATA